MVVLLLVFPGISFAFGCPTASEDEVLARINEIRRADGSPELLWDPRLFAAASRHTGDMAKARFLAHRGSDDSLPGLRIRDEGYVAATAETVGAGQPDPASIVAAWLASSRHEEILRSPRWTHLGIAHAETDSRYRHVWTANFGAAPLGATAKSPCESPPAVPASAAP